MRFAGRFGALLAGAWAGVLLCIGALAAPAAFSTLPVLDAGRYAGRLFAEEAYVGLSVALVLFLIERQRSRELAEARLGSVFSVNLMLVLAAMFFTVAGYFALLPMVEPAKAGKGPISFAALHAIMGSLFVLKGLAVLALAWRLTGFRSTATTS